MIRLAFLGVFCTFFAACGDGGHFRDVGVLADTGDDPIDATPRDFGFLDTGTSTTGDAGLSD